MLELERNALVWGVTGNLGGGKSLTSVYFMVSSMASGVFVVTNITLNIDLIASVFGDYVRKLYLHVDLSDPAIDPFKFPTGDPRGSQGRRRVICCFDECAEWFDQYVNAKDPKVQRLWSWLRHSSKRSQDVFLIVQRPDYLHKVLRILVARWLVVNDLAVWRIPFIRAKLPFMGGFIVCVPYDRSGARVGGASFVSKSNWGKFYNTAECLNNDGSATNFIYDMPEIQHRQSNLIFLLYLASLFLLIFIQFLYPYR